MDHYPLVEYTYDSFGNTHIVTTYSADSSSAARATTYTYDKNNRVTNTSYPYVSPNPLGDEHFWYNELGGIRYKKDGNDKVAAYRYDDQHRLVNVYYDYDNNYHAQPQYSGGWPDHDEDIPSNYVAQTGDVSYSYVEGSTDYGSSLKTSMTDGSGTSTFEYDARGRLVKYTPPTGLGTGYYVRYDYNNLGQKTYTKIMKDGDPNANPPIPDDVQYDAEYTYYANGWLKDVMDGASLIAQYTYDDAGNRERVRNGNTTYTDYAYDNTDPRYPLASIKHYKIADTDPNPAADTLLADIDYTATVRDNRGNPMSMTDWTGEWDYTYDANNRLLTCVPPNPVPDQPAGGSYGYDWAANRLSPPSGSNHMVYNAVDQLTVWPGMHRYTYNGDGSLNQMMDAAGANVLWSYTYTDAGLLDQAKVDGTTTQLQNAWDARHNRVQMVISNTGSIYDGTYSFVYDVTAGVPSVIAESKVGGDPVYYYREPSGALVARQAGSDWKYYHFDELGSTRLLTGSGGSVTDKYAYDAWGSLISRTGTTAQPYRYVGRLGYYTHYQKPDLALLQLGVRFYDPQLGGFTQRDPIRSKDGLATYAYSDDSPLSRVDPSGKLGTSLDLCVKYPWACAGLGIVGVETCVGEGAVVTVGTGVAAGTGAAATFNTVLDGVILALGLMCAEKYAEEVVKCEERANNKAIRCWRRCWEEEPWDYRGCGAKCQATYMLDTLLCAEDPSWNQGDRDCEPVDPLQ